MTEMWVRAVWREDGAEEEGTVPATWIRDNVVLWPNTSNAYKYMLAGKVPTSTWRRFPLVKEKFKSASRSECEAFNVTTSAETEDEEEDLSTRHRIRKRTKVLDDFYLRGETSEKDAPSPKKTGSSREAPKGTSLLVSLPPPPSKHQRQLSPPPLSFRVQVSPRHSPRSRQSPPKTSSPLRTSSSPRTSSSQRTSTSPRTSISTPLRTSTPPRTSTPKGPLTSPRSKSSGTQPSAPRRQPSPSGCGWSAIVSPRRSPRKQTSSREQIRNTPQTNSRVEETRASYPIPEEKFQRKVFSLLAELRLELREIKQMIEIGSPQLAAEGGIPLQTRTVEELDMLEDSLSSSDDQNRILNANRNRCAGHGASRSSMLS